MPRDDFAGIVGFADEDVRTTPARVLWVGDDELIPGGDGWRLGEDLAYTAATGQAVPGVADLWPATADGASERLGDALALALEHDTTRLGRVLAPMGVQYIAVPRRLAPADDTSRTTPPQVAADRAADDLAGALAEQLDLQQVRLDPGLVLYRNTAALPLRSAFPGGDVDDLSDARPVLDDEVGARAASGAVPGGATVVQGSTASDNWHLRVTGAGDADHGSAHGWADAFTIEQGGDAHLTYRTPLGARALVIAQVGLWLVALAVALRMRFGPGDAAPAPDAPAGAEAEQEADPVPPERVLVGQASEA